MGPKTEVTDELITGYFNQFSNQTLAEVMYKSLEIVAPNCH